MTTISLAPGRPEARLARAGRPATLGHVSGHERPHRDERAPWTIASGTLAGLGVAAAMGTSSIVFSEPAVADMLMAAVIVGLPVLGAARFGNLALINISLWLIFVAFGIAGAPMATTFETAIVHQFVTLFLALGAFILAGYIAADPEPRFRLVMTWYTVGCLLATAAAFVGYFNILPGAYDLFTNYGRARGTFKDPNVFGAALAPAIVYLVWVALRQPMRKAVLAAAVCLPLCLGLLLSFSRGAWASTAFSILAAVWLAMVTTRRSADVRRFVIMSALGTFALAATVGGAIEMEAVQDLFAQRASLDQSYDEGPEGRFGGQAKAIQLILENPFGIGTHSFRDTYHSEEAHNVYLSQYLNAGWIGGTLYIASVLVTLGAGFHALHRRNAVQGPLIVATAAFAGVVFEGFVVDTDHWRHFFILMALVWGLIDAGRPRTDRERRADD